MRSGCAAGGDLPEIYYPRPHAAGSRPLGVPLGRRGQLPHCVGKHEPHTRTVDADAREHVVDAQARQ